MHYKISSYVRVWWENLGERDFQFCSVALVLLITVGMIYGA